MSDRHKVLLYNPKAVFYDMPLALMAIASPLDRSKFEPFIFDGRLLEDPIAALRPLLQDALCFAVSVLTGSPLRDALAVSRAVKRIRPDLPIVWGGWHTSLFPQQVLQDESCVDITVQGQGEQTFQEILQALLGEMELSEVKGICLRKEGKIVQNPPRALEDMNSFAPVDYSLIDVEAYFAKKGRRQLDYISSTGCFFRCSFCADPFVFNRKFSAITGERVAEELAQLWQKYRFNDLNFQDETFFTYPKRIREMVEAFLAKELKFSWAATMRADQGCRMEEEEWQLAKASGLRRLLIGVESGTQEMMDYLKKDIKLEQVFECAERCKRLGIDVNFPFIVGFPKETEESFLASLEVAKKLSAMSPGFRTQVFYFKPYPGSQITADVVKEGYQLPQKTEDWGDFDYVGSKGPWVSEEKYLLVEKFKFYNRLANTRKSSLLRPVNSVARWRLAGSRFGFPIEMWLAKLIRPDQQLS